MNEGKTGAGRLLLVEPLGGLSGDMFLAAFLELGLPRERLETNLARIGLGRLFDVAYGRTTRQSLVGGRIDFPCLRGGELNPAPKSPAAVAEFLAAAGLPSQVRQISERLFALLAAAEAQVHGTTLDKVHFHEVGDYDTLADFVGCATALDWLQPTAVNLRPVPLGCGSIDSAHGRLPLPGPAATILLEGLPVVETGIEAELVTPSGAAICRYLFDSFPNLFEPVHRLGASGCGAGRRELVERPNLLRLRLGELTVRPPVNATFAREEIVELATLLDDSSPEKVADLAAELRRTGALEVWIRPVIMKKGRPGSELLLLCLPEREEVLVECLFVSSSTLGVRRRFQERYRLERRNEEFITSFGRLRGKSACDSLGRRLNFKFEHDDIAARARENGLAPAELETLVQAELIRSRLKEAGTPKNVDSNR
jgi:uncharacterized protein (TIGR00299 family) protein